MTVSMTYLTLCCQYKISESDVSGRSLARDPVDTCTAYNSLCVTKVMVLMRKSGHWTRSLV